METEVTVNYSKSCLGEGSKGKLEFLDTVWDCHVIKQTGLPCGQADQTPPFLIFWVVSSLRKGL